MRRLSDQKILADVKRNLPGFWHEWVEHPNGCEYLLCGEDYQGYCVLNLTKKEYHVFFPERGYRGMGFCWAQVVPSPDRLALAVWGCYWASPYDIHFVDFRTPDVLPLPELGAVETVEEIDGWVNNSTFSMKREIEVRKSDRAPYESLSEAEQDAIDAAEDLTEYVLVPETFTRPGLEHSCLTRHSTRAGGRACDVSGASGRPPRELERFGRRLHLPVVTICAARSYSSR